MRAHFVRGGEPKETMDIGRYRTEGNLEDLFGRMHQMAEKSPKFDVTPIRRGGKEPSFVIRGKDNQNLWTLYLTGDQGITMFDDLSDNEYPDLTIQEFLNLTKIRPGIKESQNFERGLDPKKSLDVGLEHKYGRMYNLFTICHNLSLNSDSFEWVSDIAWNPEDADHPYFNIESLFYYTDEDNNKIPEQFVVRLYPDELEIYNVITKDEDYVKSVRKFIEITSAYEEETARELGGYLEKF